MIKNYILREVIRLLLLNENLSHVQIGRLTHCPRQTVDDLHKKLIASNIDAISLGEMDDDALRAAMYPKMVKKTPQKVAPNYPEIVNECIKAHKKYRKTIWVKFCEYKQKHGDKGYGRSRFYQLIADYIKRSRLSMLQIFAPGEVMFIDYAGATLSYENNGEKIITYAFVATLGYSTRRFAHTTKDMSAKSWIEACIAAMDFFGGVPEVIHCDNAKAMVKKAGLIAELSRSASEFAEHYGVFFDTSQIATPTHNPLAENRVKELTHSVFATMNTDLSFFSIEEMNDHLNKAVEKRNDTLIQRLGLSANDVFYSDECHQLQPLPKKAFEPITFRSVVKVPENYFVWYEGNRYSVPYEYRNDYIELRVKGNKLHILHKGILRVTHDVVTGKNNIVSIDAHLHPSHLAQKYKTKSHYLAWAKTVSVSTELIVNTLYSQTRHAHSRPAGKRCMALRKLYDKFGEVSFIAACQHALDNDMISITEIDLILKSGVYDVEPEVSSTSQIKHTNVRGQAYFTGANNE